MKEKKTFLMSFDWQDFFDNLKKPTEKVKLINAIFAHAQNQNRLSSIENSMANDTKMAWIAIKKTMTQFANDYKEKCAKNRQNASLGGQAKARNFVANASERHRTLANGSETCPNDNDYDNDYEYLKEREKERKEKISLSQKKFSEIFKTKQTTLSNDIVIPQNFDIDILADKIKQSSFLSSCDNLGLEWCIQHYDEILADKYKNFRKQQSTEDPTKIKNREYTKEEQESIFDNFNNIEL